MMSDSTVLVLQTVGPNETKTHLPGVADWSVSLFVPDCWCVFKASKARASFSMLAIVICLLISCFIQSVTTKIYDLKPLCTIKTVSSKSSIIVAILFRSRALQDTASCPRSCPTLLPYMRTRSHSESYNFFKCLKMSLSRKSVSTKNYIKKLSINVF